MAKKDQQELRMTVAKRIRARREELKLNGLEVARKLGMSQPAYSKLETGGRKIEVELLLKIADVLECSVLDLVATEPSRRIYLGADVYLSPETARGLRALLSTPKGRAVFDGLLQQYARNTDEVLRVVEPLLKLLQKA